MKKFVVAAMLALSVTFGFGGVALAASPIDAARNQACQGIEAQARGSCGPGAGADISRVLRFVLQILTWIAGITAVIMVVVAGLKYITSGGDSSSVAGAKQALIYALVGIIIVALAQVIVRFVLQEAAA
ncbi:MAG TPA: hypothetical protein VK978_01005 [Candidatus Saccharimonadales bacterium]|nr:hypothetical protein [Candidatus Saccharimonadales bacterium]